MTMRRYNRPQIRAAVLHILEHHRGPDASITMLQLFVAATGEIVIPGRKYDQTRIIRSVIDQLREEGTPVCYDGSGYFLARNTADIEPTVRHLESRALSHFKTAANLRRCSVQDLLRRYQHNLALEEETRG